jgi:hypothetical protein
MSIASSANVCVALFDFEASKAGDLALHKGDVIERVVAKSARGWWTGSLNGQIGVFP